MVGRRRFARSTLAAALVAVAGCAGRGAGDENGGDVLLCSVELSNADDAPHELALAVQYDEETLLDESFSLAAMENHTQGGGIVEHDWPDDPGAYEISAALDGGESEEWDLDELYPDETTTLRMEVEITSDGALELWHARRGSCDG